MTTNLTWKNDQSSYEKMNNIWNNKNDLTGIDKSSTIWLHFLCATMRRSDIENSSSKSLKIAKNKNWKLEIGKNWKKSSPCQKK